MAEHLVESPEKAALRRRASDVDAAPTVEARGPAAHPVLRLQGQIGNAHVARLLAQRAEAGKDEDEATAAASHDLSVQRADDEDEKTAAASHDLAQRADEDEGAVNAKHETVGVEGGPVGPDTQSQIHEMRGGGSPLDEGTRTSMESAFDTSFSDVRVHSGAESDTLNRRLTARAFTTGSDIFLRSDASPSDTRLMAHELTHVVQQRTMSGGGGMQVGAAGDGNERHADAVAEAVTSTAPKPAPAGPAAQRAADQDAPAEVQAEHEALAQRAEQDEEEKATAAATHETFMQRAGAEDEDKEAQATHDLAQRAATDDEDKEAAAASHDHTQRAEAEEQA